MCITNELDLDVLDIIKNRITGVSILIGRYEHKYSYLFISNFVYVMVARYLITCHLYHQSSQISVFGLAE